MYVNKHFIFQINDEIPNIIIFDHNNIPKVSFSRA